MQTQKCCRHKNVVDTNNVALKCCRHKNVADTMLQTQTMLLVNVADTKRLLKKCADTKIFH